jgi:hypothetical protein
MPELADIFRSEAGAYLGKYGDRIPPQHRRAISDIIKCRSPGMGHGGVYLCECGETHYSYHSCGNRSCPKCGNDKVAAWLEKRLAERLPVEHFLVTFPLPSEFRQICWKRQREMFDIFFRASSEALMELALDRRFIGGRPGIAGFLQTWDRKMGRHPHIHYIVPGGGVSEDGGKWIYLRKKGFLVHAKALAKLFRGKFRAEIEKAGFSGEIPPEIWRKNWVADCISVGDGAPAYKYLAAYTQRSAITNNRITDFSDGKVSYRWKESETEEWKTRTLPALAFMALFLQHILPKGFVRTRYYGFMAPAAKQTRKRLLVAMIRSRRSPPQENRHARRPGPTCPKCGKTMMFQGIWSSARGPPSGQI